MTQAQLIAHMLDAAKDVTKAYWTDLCHDAATISAAAPGADFLWGPRDSGTCLVVLRRAKGPNTRALEAFHAFAEITPPCAWYRLTIDERCGFSQCWDAAAALDLAERAQIDCDSARTGAVVSELHL